MHFAHELVQAAAHGEELVLHLAELVAAVGLRLRDAEIALRHIFADLLHRLQALRDLADDDIAEAQQQNECDDRSNHHDRHALAVLRLDVLVQSRRIVIGDFLQTEQLLEQHLRRTGLDALVVLPGRVALAGIRHLLGFEDAFFIRCPVLLRLRHHGGDVRQHRAEALVLRPRLFIAVHRIMNRLLDLLVVRIEDMLDDAHLDHAHVVDFVAQQPDGRELAVIHVIEVGIGLDHGTVAGKAQHRHAEDRHHDNQ